MSSRLIWEWAALREFDAHKSIRRHYVSSILEIGQKTCFTAMGGTT